MAVDKYLFFLSLIVCLLASVERYSAVYSVKINWLRLTTATGDGLAVKGGTTISDSVSVQFSLFPGV